MPVVDVGSIVTRFQIKDLEKQLELLEKVENKIDELEGKKISLSVEAKGVREAQSGLSNLMQSMQRMRQGAGQVVSGMKQVFKGVIQPFRDMVGVMNAGRKSLMGMGDQITHMGQIAAATAFRLQLLLTPVQLLAGSIAKSAIDLQHEVAKISTQTRLSGEEAVAFQKRTADAIRETTNTIAISNEEASEAVFDLVGSLNLSQEAALGLLPIIAKYSVAGDAMASTISKLGVLLLASFAPDALDDPIKATAELDKMLGQIFVSMKDGVGDMQDMTEQIGDFTQITKILGGTLPEALSLFTILTREIGVAEAATQVKRLSRTLLTTKFAEQMESLGISMTTINEQGMERLRGPFQILGDLANLVQDATPENLAIISETFPNIRALLPFLTFLTKENREEWERMNTTLNDSAEVTRQVDAGFDTMSGTTKNLLQVMRQAIGNLGTLVEEDLRERMAGGIKLVTDGFIRLQEMPQETRQSLSQFIIILSALPPLMLAISVAIMGAGGLVSALGTLLSPAVLGLAGLLFVTFKDELAGVNDILQNYNLSTLEGIAQFIGELAVSLGLVNVEQAEHIFDVLKISADIDPTNVDEMQKSIGAVGDQINRIKDPTLEWFDAFGEWLDMVERREGIIGTLIRMFEAGAGMFSRLPGLGGARGTGVPGDEGLSRVDTIDIAAGIGATILGTRFLGPILGGAFSIIKGVTTILGGVGATVGGNQLFAQGAMRGFGRSIPGLGLLSLVLGASFDAKTPQEALTKMTGGIGVPPHELGGRQVPKFGPSALIDILDVGFEKVFTPFENWFDNSLKELSQQNQFLKFIYDALKPKEPERPPKLEIKDPTTGAFMSAAGEIVPASKKILEGVDRLISGETFAELNARQMFFAAGQAVDTAFKEVGLTSSFVSSLTKFIPTVNVFEFQRRLMMGFEGPRPFSPQQLAMQRLPETGGILERDLPPMFTRMTDILSQLEATGVELSEGSIITLVNEFAEADTTEERQEEILTRLEEMLRASATRQEGMISRLANALYALTGKIAGAVTIFPGARGETFERPLRFHTGGFIDILQSEFVTSPLTTRLLESVVGDQLTQQNLQQLALAHAGIQSMTHNVNITPQRAFDINLSARGLSGFELSQGQKDELGWEITGFVAKRFREVLQANG